MATEVNDYEDILFLFTYFVADRWFNKLPICDYIFAIQND